MKVHIHRDELLEQDVAYNHLVEASFLVVMAILLAGHLTVIGFQLSLQKLPFELMTYVFSPLILVHALYMLGWRRALAFFLVTVVLSFGFEHVGVRTGWIFGHYHYTDVLDPKLLGTVPVVIPLAYFMVVYPSYMMANLIIRGRPTGKFQGPAVILLSSLLTGMIMTSWDLTMDPVMVHDVKAWVWEQGGHYFGVPFQNFLGWMVTVVTISVCYRLVEQVDRFPMRPFGRGHKLVIVLPLVGYGTLMLGGPFVGVPVETRLLSPFAMGLPLFAALMRLYGPELGVRVAASAHHHEGDPTAEVDHQGFGRSQADQAGPGSPLQVADEQRQGGQDEALREDHVVGRDTQEQAAVPVVPEPSGMG